MRGKNKAAASRKWDAAVCIGKNLYKNMVGACRSGLPCAKRQKQSHDRYAANADGVNTLNVKVKFPYIYHSENKMLWKALKMRF